MKCHDHERPMMLVPDVKAALVADLGGGREDRDFEKRTNEATTGGLVEGGVSKPASPYPWWTLTMKQSIEHPNTFTVIKLLLWIFKDGIPVLHDLEQRAHPFILKAYRINKTSLRRQRYSNHFLRPNSLSNVGLPDQMSGKDDEVQLQALNPN